ncbi:MAG: hypothetical protein HWN66_15590 [Candidatus Helarchaeota archaeon]|nr:hypothetical protein [Candidatus Helarchaeota archaeon]
MEEKPCVQCQTQFHPSNLIEGTICVDCHAKNFQIIRRHLGGVGFCHSIYKIMPIIAALIGFIYLILNLTHFIAFVSLFCITGILFVICIWGVIPYYLPPLWGYSVQEVELKFKAQFENSLAIKYCLYHPDLEAIGRCSICIQPFCTDDFIFLFEKPILCRECGLEYISKISILTSLNALFSIGILSGVGIFIEIVYYILPRNMTWVGIAFFVVLIATIFIFARKLHPIKKEINSQLKKLISNDFES